jgi:S-adenosylmethionine:tRNA ribosyltransferase-isomerase
MRVDAFDFELPPELIAQQPSATRGGSRLLVLDRETGGIAHRRFDELGTLLRPGDLLVMNDTKVIPARLIGRKESGGRVELLLVEPVERDERSAVWRCLIKASRKPAPGSRLRFDLRLSAELLDRDGGGWRVRLRTSGDSLDDELERIGRPPLPPYIRRDDADESAEDRRRYQTVYAREPGAIAAPTAGLHFSEEQLERLEARGVRQGWLTLHVGLGTFRPVEVEQVEEHRMHEERYELPPSLARAVAETREAGGRVVAVGTTSVRTLEQQAADGGRVEAGSGRSALFIYPGFGFRVVDAMITNFHLPRSTLLMLVSAFAGRERVLEAYRRAVAERYRFFSYGDAMWIGPTA